jgi:uncharacterized SAM-binding protein YcdF (DUF218 family)
MFTISKVLWWFVEPSNLALLVLSAGTVLLWTRWAHIARILVACLAAALIAVAVLPLGLAMIEPLENRFPRVREPQGAVAGVVVLGGSVNQFLTQSRDQVALGGGAERLTEFVAIARKRPDLRLVFTGGSGSLFHQDTKETAVARRLFADLGLDPARVVFEDLSRNTYENAVFTHRLIQPATEERWLLMTSAMHMPRAVGSFRKAGWHVVPYPVDYVTPGDGEFALGFSLVDGLDALSVGVREWLGLVSYRLLDRTDSLFPGPSR